jgi:hypothetical protein
MATRNCEKVYQGVGRIDCRKTSVRRIILLKFFLKNADIEHKRVSGDTQVTFFLLTSEPGAVLWDCPSSFSAQINPAKIYQRAAVFLAGSI